MRPANEPMAGAGSPPPRVSTLPYLLRGLGAVVGLIAFALIVLACSFRHSRRGDRASSSSSSSSAPPHQPDKPPKPLVVAAPDVEPKIVVVMAGDEEPTFLAKPISRPAPS